MNKNKIIETGNKEALGELFLEKGAEFAVQKSYGKAYEFFKEGLDILTHDGIGSNHGWLKSYFNSDKKMFIDIANSHSPYYEYLFVKAYIMSYEECCTKDLYVALDAIDKYIDEIQDEYGYYVKGKILVNMLKYEEALDCFITAKEYNDSPRIKYYIGDIREGGMNKYGIDQLYFSFLENSTSVCCISSLRKHSLPKVKLLPLEENETNVLLLMFNDYNKDECEFQDLFEEILSQETYKGEDSRLIIKKFVQVLRDNSDLFIEKELNIDDLYEYNEVNDDYEDDPTYEDNTDYERDTFYTLTNRQYGSYEDWKENGGDIDSLKDIFGD